MEVFMDRDIMKEYEKIDILFKNGEIIKSLKKQCNLCIFPLKEKSFDIQPILCDKTFRRRKKLITLQAKLYYKNCYEKNVHGSSFCGYPVRWVQRDQKE